MADTKKATETAKAANGDTPAVVAPNAGSTEGKLVGTSTSAPIRFEVKKGKMPENLVSASSTGQTGLAASVRGLKAEGDYIDVPRIATAKGYKRDNSKFATIVRLCKEAKPPIPIAKQQVSDTLDRVWFDHRVK